MIGVQPLHTSWNMKQKARMEQKLMKVYEKELKDEAKKQKEVTYLHVLSQCQFLLQVYKMHTSNFNARGKPYDGLASHPGGRRNIPCCLMRFAY